VSDQLKIIEFFIYLINYSKKKSTNKREREIYSNNAKENKTER
jgi:hypothetical protein